MVEDIEKLRPELDVQRFPDRRVLQDRQIGTEKVGADRDVPSTIAERTLRLQGKARGIEPLIHVVLLNLATCHVIRPVGTLRISSLNSGYDVDRNTAVGTVNSGDLPALD